MAGFGKKGAVSQPLVASSRGHISPNNVLKFDVTPKPAKMILGIAFFGAGALIFFDKLLDPRGIIINGLIELGPAGADIFYSVLILASAVFVAFGIVGLIKSFGEPTFIVLDSQSISGPTRYGGSSIARISFNAVRDVNVSSISNHEFLVVTGSDGRKIKVGQANFRNSSDWSHFLAELNAKLRFSGTKR